MYRRNLVSVRNGATAVSLSGFASHSPAGTASAEAALSVEDATREVTSADGVLDKVWIHFEVDFEYSGWQDHEITGIGFHTKIDGETIDDRVYSLDHPDWIRDEPGDEDSGSGTFRSFQGRLGSRDRIFLFEDAPNYQRSDLAVDEPGETQTFELDLYVEMRLVANEDTVVWTDSNEATITITHTHESVNENDTEVDTTVPDPVTETPNQTNSTIAPRSYSYYPSLTINSQKYHVLSNLTLSDEPASWAVVRGSLDQDEYQLASLNATAEALEMLSWQQRPSRDFGALEEEAKDLIDSWRIAKTWNELAQLGVDLGVVIALLKTGNASLATGIIIETVEDVASWTWESAGNPYQEVYSRTKGICASQQRVRRLAEDTERIADTPQTIASLVSTAIGAYTSDKSAMAAKTYTAAVLGSLAAGDSVYQALGKGSTTNSILYADRGELISTSVQVGSNGYEAFAKVGGIAIGMHKARIPLLRRLSTLQKAADQGTLTFHGTDSIIEFYTAEASHDMMCALGNAAMYEVSNESATSRAGPLYNVLNNLNDIATEANESKESYLDSAAVLHDLAGQRFYTAQQRFQDSVNLARAGQNTRQNPISE